MKESNWLKLNAKENKLVCERCGGKRKMPEVLIEVKKYLGIISEFRSIHSKCVN